MSCEYTKELCYVLGFIWADGGIYFNKNKKFYRCQVECCYDDLSTIEFIFNSINVKWGKYCRNRKNRKPQMCLTTSNKNFCNFLIENDFLNKKKHSPEIIINKIPEELIIYFIRGIMDGDGCFYLSEKNNCVQLSIASSIEQDWRYLEDLFNKYSIRYIISRYENKKKHRSSVIRICSKYDVIDFGKILYKIDDKIYLKRKKDKFDKICLFSNCGNKIAKRSKKVERYYIYSE